MSRSCSSRSCALAGGGGVGWQAWFGGLLTLVGVVNLIQPDIGGLIVPIALVALGAALVFGGLLGPDRRGRRFS